MKDWRLTHRAFIFVPVVDAADNRDLGVYMRGLPDSPTFPRTGESIEVLDGVFVRIQDVLHRGFLSSVELLCFDLRGNEDTVEALLAREFVEVDQHGEPISADAPADAAEPVASEA